MGGDPEIQDAPVVAETVRDRTLVALICRDERLSALEKRKGASLVVDTLEETDGCRREDGDGSADGREHEAQTLPGGDVGDVAGEVPPFDGVVMGQLVTRQTHRFERWNRGKTGVGRCSFR